MPITTLDAAIAQVRVYALALTGMRATPATPTDSVPVTPACIVYSGAESWEPLPGNWKKGLCAIICEIMVPHKDLARDYATLSPYSELFQNKILANPTLNGTVNTVVFPTTTPGIEALGEYSGLPMLGWRISIPVKLETAIT
jgi:hypothetical protein